MTCIRGATTVKNNDTDEILNATTELLKEIIAVNNIRIKDIISIVFTATPDLNKVYPARAAREIGIIQAGLMCVQEMNVENSLPMCIRVLVSVEWDKAQASIRHVYLNEATSLRPDLSRKFAVAIDGPSGAGKSSAAKAVARELGFTYVDTGAMYRAVALYCIRNSIRLNDIEDVERALDDIHISIDHVDGTQRIIMNDEDVTTLIRTNEVADGSSKVAAIEPVRKKLVSLQREIGVNSNVVMDGRDIAVNVLPWAQVKIYLDASVDVRTGRRCGELREKGLEADYEKVRVEIEERDYRDTHRVHSPLRRHEEAILIDTSGMDQAQVCICVVKICRDAMKNLPSGEGTI